MLVASIGVTGAIVAAILTHYFHWRTVYFIGGGLGLSLLLLRVSVIESKMFSHAQENEVAKGNFFQLFSNGTTFIKYLKCILIGIPIWWVIGFLILYATKFVKVSNISATIDFKAEQPTIIMLYYIGLTFGDILSGFVSQVLKSRKKAVLVFFPAMVLFSLIYFFVPIESKAVFFALCIALGVSCGYWAIFITIAAEQFGTNIRSTVSTTAPNFVRGAFVILNYMLVGFMLAFNDNLLVSVLVVGVLAFGAGLWALLTIEETFGKDMDYLEV